MSFKQPYILAVDIGTSGIRASIYDGEANELPELKFKASTPFSTGGTVAPDAEALLAAVLEVLDGTSEAAARAGIKPVFGAVSCFWHSLVGVDADGLPTTPVLSWADTRSEGCIAKLRADLSEHEVHQRTGCHFHSSYWPAKLLYIKDKNPDTFERTANWLSFSDLVIRRLTGKQVTGLSMASATGLFDLRKGEWDSELVPYLGLRQESLPSVAAEGFRSTMTESSVERWSALGGTQWLSPIGDGAANNLGAGCVGPGNAALMIGTSGAMRMVLESEVPERIPEGLFCYRLDGSRVCVGGAISDGGSLIKWLTGPMGLSVDEDELVARLERKGPDAHRLSFLPFVFGERSTGYHEKATGALIGLTRGSDAADIVTAAMESVAYRFADILERLEEVCPVKHLTVSGGSVEASPFWQRLIADILGRDLEIYPSGGVSRKGAAVLGLEAAFGRTDIGHGRGMDVRFDPGSHASYRSGLERHRRFYKRQIC